MGPVAILSHAIAGCSVVIFMGTFGSPVRAHQSETRVQAVITHQGQIEYYSVPSVGPRRAEKAKHSFEHAVKANIGMQEYLKKHPDTMLFAGTGDVVHAMSVAEVKKARFQAAPFNVGAVGPQLVQAFPGVFQAVKIDTATFLKNLAKSMTDQVTTLSCSLGVPPDTVQATASVFGVVSFSATWKTEKLCKQ